MVGFQEGDLRILGKSPRRLVIEGKVLAFESNTLDRVVRDAEKTSVRAIDRKQAGERLRFDQEAGEHFAFGIADPGDKLRARGDDRLGYGRGIRRIQRARPVQVLLCVAK